MWPGWSEQRFGSDRWFPCELSPLVAVVGRCVGRAQPDRSNAPSRRRTSYGLRQRQATKIGLVGRPTIQARMRPLAVVERQVTADRATRLGHAVIGAQIDLFVLDGPPQPFDEHVVAPRAATIHTDPYRVPQ